MILFRANLKHLNSIQLLQIILLSQYFSPFTERAGERAMTHFFTHVYLLRREQCVSLIDFIDGVLALTRKTSNGGNPWASVLVSWMLAQVGWLNFIINRGFFRQFH